MSKIKQILDESIDNAREDRKKALSLLEDITDYMSSAQDKHREVGLVAAKYLETLQRSNEQFVKAAALMKNLKDEEFGDLEEEEKEEIYTQFEEEKSDKKA